MGGGSHTTTRRQIYDRAIANRRAQDDVVREYSRFAQNHTLMKEYGNKEDSIALKRFQRQQDAIRAEQEQEQALRAAAQQRIERRLRQEQEEKIAQKMAVERDKELNAILMPQRIIKDSQEIRELEEKLKAAYVSKELAAQIEQKASERRREADEERQLYADGFRDGTRAAAERHEREEAERRILANIEMRDYAASVTQRENERRMAEAAERERDAAQVAEVVQKIMEEETHKQRELHERILKERKDMEEYLQQREEVKAQQRAEQEAEKLIVQQHHEHLDQRAAEEKERFNRLQAAREKIYGELAEELEKQQRDRDRLESLRIELADAQLELLALRDEEIRAEKAREARQIAREAVEESWRMKREAEEQRRQEEEIEKRELLEKYRQAEELERLSALAKRRKITEYKAILDQESDARRKQREQDLERERIEFEREQREAERQERVIEEERRRLIREHASQLIGFLPQGVLSTDEDLQYLPEEVQEEIYKQRRERELIRERGMTPEDAEARVLEEEKRFGKLSEYFRAKDSGRINGDGRVHDLQQKLQEKREEVKRLDQRTKTASGFPW